MQPPAGFRRCPTSKWLKPIVSSNDIKIKELERKIEELTKKLEEKQEQES
jgi:hypothetical protein